jgi:hypothetical protein
MGSFGRYDRGDGGIIINVYLRHPLDCGFLCKGVRITIFILFNNFTGGMLCLGGKTHNRR